MLRDKTVQSIIRTAAQAFPSSGLGAACKADHHCQRARAAGDQPVLDEHGPTLPQKKARSKPGLCYRRSVLLRFLVLLDVGLGLRGGVLAAVLGVGLGGPGLLDL